MDRAKLITVKTLRVGDAVVTVEVFRNAGNSFAARCMLGTHDTPIIDAPSADEALAAVADALEGLLFARRSAARRTLAA